MELIRKEIKFQTNNKISNDLKNSISSVLSYDDNNKDNGSYRVFSIYFDDENLTFYKEKIEGLNIRVKPRLRFYFDKNLNPIKSFLELKKRKNFFVKKIKTEITIADAKIILSGNINKLFLKYKNNECFLEFYKLTKLMYLKPKITIFYDRSAFFFRFNRDVRITFDKNIFTSFYSNLNFNFNHSKRIIKPNLNIIELKYNYSIPNMVLHNFKFYNLEQCTFSKYCMGLNQCYNFKK